MQIKISTTKDRRLEVVLIVIVVIMVIVVISGCARFSVGSWLSVVNDKGWWYQGLSDVSKNSI